jgi:DNA-directed RNA polymerase sigma subunit (sigma70/sigma32)
LTVDLASVTVFRRMKEQRPQGQKGRVATETTSALEPVEEKVIRMRHGLPAPDRMALERVGEAHPETQRALREIELRALERSGRLAELRDELGLESVDPSPGVKDKIISRIRDE